MSLDELYPKDVMRLAARASASGRLATPTGTAVRANPICGDRVTADVQLSGDIISAIGFDVKACVLCQASASILGDAVPGETRASLSALERALRAMLKESAAPPGGKFAAYAALAPVADHASRHGCVLLPIEALREALEP